MKRVLISLMMTTTISIDSQTMAAVITSTESYITNTTQSDDGNVETAAVYRAEDFAAMAIVFTVVLILSFLWQKRFPPFCMFKRSDGPTLEGIKIIIIILM